MLRSTQTESNIDIGYLIIAGATKSATTSLFRYLGDHPVVSIPFKKETRFFLSNDYPLSKPSYNSYDLSTYAALFNPPTESTKLRVESTPDYLHCSGTATRIKKLIPDAKFVFCLRPPRARLQSWYRYGIQIGVIEPRLSFKDYILSQVRGESIVNHPAWMALEHGLYGKYLREFSDLFGKESILLIDYNSLLHDPLSVMHTICHFAEIDSGFFNTYTFEIFNESKNTTHLKTYQLYSSLLRLLKIAVKRSPSIRKLLRTVRHKIEPVFFKVNESSYSYKLSEELLAYLDDYYQEDTLLLKKSFAFQFHDQRY